MRIIYENKNIIVREFKPEEQQLFVQLFEHPEVTKYLPYRSPELYAELFGIALEDYKNGFFGRFGVFDVVTHDFIGMCLVRNFEDVAGQIEIGYTLHKRYWGRGYATGISRALIAYIFKNTTANEVVAVTDLNNTGSQKVLLKVGLSRMENIKRPEAEMAYYLITRHLPSDKPEWS
ncbi:GNAT family N-acetyltransferase [Pedobacter sp. AW31-3R]|uniref:GNAT family N-acetyltransferase n=1 Tax=Pedobacter sp. AW31-3R TaxID=3445781 RepID=UPI003FA0D69F